MFDEFCVHVFRAVFPTSASFSEWRETFTVATPSGRTLAAGLDQGNEVFEAIRDAILFAKKNGKKIKIVGAAPDGFERKITNGSYIDPLTETQRQNLQKIFTDTEVVEAGSM